MQNKRGAALLDKGERAFKVEPSVCSRRALFMHRFARSFVCVWKLTLSVAGNEVRDGSLRKCFVCHCRKFHFNLDCPPDIYPRVRESFGVLLLGRLKMKSEYSNEGSEA